MNTLRLALAGAVLFLLTALQPVFGQNGVKIAATSATADPSAMLDVSSTTKGVLIPRMLNAQMTAIVSPATGLLVYQTDGSSGLYYWNGSAWVQLSAGALSGSGTTNYVSKWTSSSGLGNSQITDNGTNVGIGITTATQKFQVVGGNVQINNLAGTGYRQVYASPTGILQTGFSTATVFTYTGGNQSYTVLPGVTSVTVKMWGAGGGGGYFGGWNAGFSGGGGGFTQGTIAVTPGQVLTVMVGGGGTGGNVANTANSYGGGSRSCNTGSDCRYGGQGGGRSAIIVSGADILTAGGGGGGGSSRGITMTQYGGAGGGLVGQDGSSTQLGYGQGLGGGQTYPGIGAQNMTSDGGNGAQYTGGNPGSNAYGGGGGGGWYGGGGGGYTESYTMGGAGGGSGYVGGAGVTNAFTMQGYYMQPANTGDINYATGIGVGGYCINTLTPLSGGNGLVVIYY